MHEKQGSESGLILLTGATGYIGGRLLAALEARGDKVRCLARDPKRLAGRLGPNSEAVQADVLNADSLSGVFDGVDTAYYLIHAMGAGEAFQERDRQSALHFSQAAKAAGVKRIIYVGGLGNDQEALSPHLKSRQEVGDILRDSGIPIVELRASIVIGSGSLSFEMIRSLVERLPIMITPKWVSRQAQPIAIDDLLSYLLEATSLSDDDCRSYEIGGTDVASYAEIMRLYGRCRGLKVRMIPVPLLTPYISSLWLSLITPLYAQVGRQLIASIVHSTVVRDDAARRVFSAQPMGLEAAIRRALNNEDRSFAQTRWSDALSSSRQQETPAGQEFGRRLIDSRTSQVKVPARIAFKPIQSIGGNNGWYAWNGLWRCRGFLDLMLGGIGTRRGRRHPSALRVGDTLDFWRVEALEEGRWLRLSAEIKVPGRAWLEFEITEEHGVSTIRQTAIFDPLGFWGRLYWYSLIPLHQLVFGGMLKGIAKRAVNLHVEEQKRDK